MGALKQGKPRASGRGHAAPGKRRRPLPAVVPKVPPAAGDAILDAASPFEVEALAGDADLEGAVDDWAGIDTVADMVDEPAEGRRRR